MSYFIFDIFKRCLRNRCVCMKIDIYIISEHTHKHLWLPRTGSVDKICIYVLVFLITDPFRGINLVSLNYECCLNTYKLTNFTSS